MISLQNAWLCGNDHLTESAVQCDCGSRNLVSLARILNREPLLVVALDDLPYNGLCCELPTIERLFAEGEA